MKYLLAVIGAASLFFFGWYLGKTSGPSPAPRPEARPTGSLQAALASEPVDYAQPIEDGDEWARQFIVGAKYADETSSDAPRSLLDGMSKSVGFILQAMAFRRGDGLSETLRSKAGVTVVGKFDNWLTNLQQHSANLNSSSLEHTDVRYTAFRLGSDNLLPRVREVYRYLAERSGIVLPDDTWVGQAEISTVHSRMGPAPVVFTFVLVNNDVMMLPGWSTSRAVMSGAVGTP